MKKKALILLITLFISSLFLFSDEKQDSWENAISEQNIEFRMSLLEQYAEKYAQEGDSNLKDLYYQLSLDSFNLKKYEKTITYGEKALNLENIKDRNKLQLNLLLANSYNVTKKDLDKAYHYAGLAFELAITMKANENNTKKYDKKYIVPALRIQIFILYSKGRNDPEMMNKAAEKAIEIFANYDKSTKSSNMIVTLANNLYKMKKIRSAISVFEHVCNVERPNYRYLSMLASWYSKIDDKEKAVNCLERSYRIRKNAKTAYNLGVMLQKRDIDRAIRYLAEAHIMRHENKEAKDYKLLRHLYYNVKASKDKAKEELDAGFQEIINSARSRLGK